MKKIKAFSLIELMISLIVISCIIAAFIPVISKKLNSSNVSVTGNSTSDITTECSDKFSSSCKLCTKSYCIQCELSSCAAGSYPESKSCTCKSCSNIFSNCATCDNSKCTKCINNNYYIDNGKCMDCPTGKLCDGVSYYDETVCDDPMEGYFCEGSALKKCTSKYSMYCTSCNATKCLSCANGYFVSGNNCVACSNGCKKCTSPSHCTECYSWRLLNSSTYTCEQTCKSVMSNCYLCSDSSACTKCNGGYYVDSSNKCSPCTNISNCINCSSASTCTQCKQGYYLNSSNKCLACTVLNCATCAKDGTCESCNQGYHLSKDKKTCEANDSNFNCSDSNFMRIGNLCVTRKNMGDSLMLPIPYTVNIAEAGSEYCYSQSQKCCWKGTTGVHCDSNNGGYSGCTRTVCNWEAAKEICAKFNYAGKTWRLATIDEAETWGVATLGLGQNGLMLCNHSTIRNDLARCNDSYVCNGSYSNGCIIRRVSLAETSTTGVGSVSFEFGNFEVVKNYNKTYAASVRCVTEME